MSDQYEDNYIVGEDSRALQLTHYVLAERLVCVEAAGILSDSNNGDFMGVWDSGDDRGYNPGDYKSDDDFWTTEDGQLLDDNYGIVESKAEWEAEQETEAEIKVRELVVEKKAQNLDQLKIGEEIE